MKLGVEDGEFWSGLTHLMDYHPILMDHTSIFNAVFLSQKPDTLALQRTYPRRQPQ